MRLLVLHLERVDLANEGMKALARVVEVGSFVGLETLICSGYSTDTWNYYNNLGVKEEEIAVADEGARALIEAVVAGGREGGRRKKTEAQGGSLLPKLLMVHLTVLGRAVTSSTLLTLVRALSRACPLLERLHLMPCWDPDPFGDMEAALKRAADGWVKAANFRRNWGKSS